jgi:hypothetical protein
MRQQTHVDARVPLDKTRYYVRQMAMPLAYECPIWNYARRDELQDKGNYFDMYGK